jgi:3-oxoacyl-[acyl-carrier protein] reductase
MDLGIAGRWAIVCGSSLGLGRACAEALAREGVNVVISGRRAEELAKAKAAIEAIASAQVIAVSCDVTTVAGHAALLEACPTPDILVNNSEGPAPKKLASISAADWADAAGRSMIAPLQLTQAVLPAMIERQFGRIVNITSAMVTTPRPLMALSSAPRAGLTAAMKAISIEVARYNVTVNNLLPERADTYRQHYMALQVTEREGISYEEARARQVESIAAKRMGRPEEFGALCAFVCSQYGGFVSGQNFHFDGGSYPALI